MSHWTWLLLVVFLPILDVDTQAQGVGLEKPDSGRTTGVSRGSCHSSPLSTLLTHASVTRLTSGMVFGTSVRFWWRQVTCHLELSQTQGCGHRWAATCQAGPSSKTKSSSMKTGVELWGLGGEGELMFMGPRPWWAPNPIQNN